MAAAPSAAVMPGTIKFDVGFAKGFDFFPGTAEDKRITTLETNYLQSEQRVLDHQRINFFLADSFVPEAFADVVELR